MRTRSVSVVAALLLAGACGGSTVDPSPHEDGPIQTHPTTAVDASTPAHDAGALSEPADAALVDAKADAISFDAACEYPLTGFTLPDLDTPCLDGPTGRQVLAMLSSSYTSTFVPSAARPPWMTPADPTAPSPLTMTVAYEAGTITCKPSPPDCDLPPGVTTCPCPEPTYGSFDIELAVTFQTADGSFDDQLAASTTFSPYATNATFTATLPADHLHGGYLPVFGITETLDFQGAFTPTGSSSGTLLEKTSQDVGGGGTWGQ